MKVTTRQRIGNAPASVDVRSRSVVAFFALVLFVCLGNTRAADQPSQPSSLPASSSRSTMDVEIEARILRALRRDSELGPLNLGAHMSGGIAKLSGPIPSTELKARAIRVVQTIEGVRGVTTKDLYISSGAPGRKRISIVIQNDQPTQTRAASPHSPSSMADTLTDSINSPRSSSAPNSFKEANRHEDSQQITLLAPEIAAPPKRAPEAASLTGNPRPASPVASIASSIDRLRRGSRYQQIRTRVEGTTVYIISGGASGDEVMMFAQDVRRLPGVRHVVIDSGSR